MKSSLRQQYLRLITLATMLLGLAGCCHCPSPSAAPPLNVKTESMAAVVAEINANNSRIPTLWAHHYFEADVVDENKQKHHAAGDGVLLYQSPTSMRLVADAAGAGTVFEIGCNPKTFWFRLGPDAGDTMWWGNWADLPGVDWGDSTIPIRPDMVLDVLGITTINTDFNAMPVPTMRYVPEGDAYVFIWNGHLPDRWIALREVWYDRASKRPRLVLLYDPNGRVALRAELDLKRYRQVAAEGIPKAQWPWMPGDYKLFFPDTGSRLIFTLDEAELHRRSGGAILPNPRSFRMPDPQNAGIGHVVEIR